MKTISTAKVLFGVIGYALLVSVFHSWQKGYSLNMAVFVMSFGSAIAIIGLAGSFYIFTSFIYLFIKDKTNRNYNCTIAFIAGVFIFSIPSLLGFPK